MSLKRILAISLPLFFVGHAAQAETFVVPAQVRFADGIDVREAVRQECELEVRLPEHIEDAARRDVEIVFSDDPAAEDVDKILMAEITYVLVTGFGPKSVTVRGELLENDEVVGSFVAARFSTRGLRTCTTLNRCIRAIGSDIAEWLENPTMNAKLGNA